MDANQIAAIEQARMLLASAPPAPSALPVQPVETVPLPAPVEEPAEKNLLKESMRRAGQEILSTPGMFGGLYGLAGAAIEKFRYGTDWDSAFLSEEGKQLLAAKDSSNPKEAAIANARLEVNPTQVLRPGLESALQWYDWGGDVTGVTDNPDGSAPLDEEVGGIILSTLPTLPLSVVSKPAAAINAVSNRVARTALKTVMHTAELATPITVGGIQNIPANAAVQLAMNDVIRSISDDPTLVDAVLGEPNGTEALIDDDGLPEGRSVGDTAAIAGGGAAAVLAASRPATLARLVNKVVPQTPPTGAPIPGDLPTGILKRIEHNVLDEKAILTDTVRKIRGDTAAETYDDTMRATAGNSANAARERYMRTGILTPDGSIKTVAPSELVTNFARMDPARREMFDQGMLAAAERTRRAHGVPPVNALGSDAVLSARVQRAQSDPEIRRMMQMYDEVISAFSDLRYREGIIGTRQYQIERAQRLNLAHGVGGFVPYYRPGQKLGAVEGFLRPRKQRERMNAGENIQPLPPMQALGDYVADQMDMISSMRVQRTFLRMTADMPVDAKNERRTVVMRGKDKGGEQFRVLENGVPTFYSVSDPRIATALRFRPHAVMPIGNAIRKLFQKGTTGDLNPMFAPMSLAYDVTFGMLAASNRNLVTGILDQQLAQRGFTPGMRDLLAGLTRPIDFTILTGQGILEGVGGRLLQMHAERMASVAAKLGTPVAIQDAERAAKAFMESKYGLMQMYGYSVNLLTDDMQQLGRLYDDSVISKLAFSHMGKATGRTYEFYKHALESITHGMRMGLFSRNLSYQQHLRKMQGRSVQLDQATMRKIANDVRNVAADPTRAGSSDTMNKVLSVIPYGNIILQSTAHLAAQMLTNRAAMSTIGTIALASWYARDSMSPEAREYVEMRQPAYKDIGFLTFEKEHDGRQFNPDTDLFRVPLGPELGTMTAMFRALFDGYVRTLSEDIPSDADPTTLDRIKEAIADALGFPVPPVLNVLATASGLGQIQPGAALDGRELFRQPRDYAGMSEMRGIGLNAGVISDRAYDVTYSLLGTLGRTIMESAEVLDTGMNRYDMSFNDAAARAMDVFYFEAVEKQPAGTLFSNAITSPSPGTRLSTQAYNLNDAMERIAVMSRAFYANTDNDMDADIPYSRAVSVMPELITDPILREQADAVHQYFLSPYHADALDRVSQLRSAYYRVKSNVVVKREVANTILRDIDQQMQDNLNLVLDNYGEFEQGMRMEYGPDWSLTTFTEAAEKDIYKRY